MTETKAIPNVSLKTETIHPYECIFVNDEVLFSEDNGEWRETPQWVNYLLSFGYQLESKPSTRRIVLISLPCDSAAAGLIALGAMRKRLEIAGADDSATHFQRIVNLARTRDTRVALIKHTERRRKYRGPYFVDGIRSEGKIWVKLATGFLGTRGMITCENAREWKFDGGPPVQAILGEKVPYENFYSAMMANSGAVNISNLCHSDSGICFAGRITGEKRTHVFLAGIRFKLNDSIADLSQLLTIQSWLPGKISRVIFFNTRVNKFDRYSGCPGLVIADGDSAFLRVLDQNGFLNASVVGVLDRTIDREKLESIGNKLAGLNQWYVQDTELQDSMKSTIKGISVLILKRA